MRLLSPFSFQRETLEMGEMGFHLGLIWPETLSSANNEAAFVHNVRYFDMILNYRIFVTEGHHSSCMFHPLETTSSYRDETAAIEGNGARWLVGARAFAKSLVGEGTCEGGAGGESRGSCARILVSRSNTDNKHQCKHAHAHTEGEEDARGRGTVHRKHAGR